MVGRDAILKAIAVTATKIGRVAFRKSEAAFTARGVKVRDVVGGVGGIGRCLIGNSTPYGLLVGDRSSLLATCGNFLRAAFPAIYPTI